MPVYYARFNEATRDFAGQTVTSDENSGIAPKVGVIYKALPDRLEDGKNYMLNALDEIVLKNSFTTFDKLAIMADGLDESNIIGLPLGTTVLVGGPAGEVEGVIEPSDNGELTVTCDMAGKIVVCLRAINYIYTEVEIIAT